jgi:hypothetical protein
MFESELGDGKRCGYVDRAGNFGGGCMEGREDVAEVLCVRYEDFRTVTYNVVLVKGTNEKIFPAEQKIEKELQSIHIRSAGSVLSRHQKD